MIFYAYTRTGIKLNDMKADRDTILPGLTFFDGSVLLVIRRLSFVSQPKTF